MKRPTDVLKWSGEGFHGERRVKGREPFSQRIAKRELLFRKAPVETLFAMAKVAGSPLGPLGSHIYPVPVTKWWRRKCFTKYLWMPLSPSHAAIWSPEAGIKVIERNGQDPVHW